MRATMFEQPSMDWPQRRKDMRFVTATRPFGKSVGQIRNDKSA